MASELAAFAAFGVHRHDAGPMEDHARSARDHPFHGQTGLGILLERGIRHLLLDLKPARFLIGIAGNRLVDVGRHGENEVKLGEKITADL